MIKWLGENGGELVGTKKYLCKQKSISVSKKEVLCVQIRFLCRKNVQTGELRWYGTHDF
jgi:hypothetical protein